MGGGRSSGRSSPVKYHYFHCFFTYSVRRNACVVSLLERLRLSRYSRSKRVRVVDTLSIACGVMSFLLLCVLSTGAYTRWSGVSLHGLWEFSGHRFKLRRDSIRGHCQAGSLTGAVHLSKNNAGVLRPAQRGQKPRVEQKGKCWLDPDIQYV